MDYHSIIVAFRPGEVLYTHLLNVCTARKAYTLINFNETSKNAAPAAEAVSGSWDLPIGSAWLLHAFPEGEKLRRAKYPRRRCPW